MGKTFHQALVVIIMLTVITEHTIVLAQLSSGNQPDSGSVENKSDILMYDRNFTLSSLYWQENSKNFTEAITSHSNPIQLQMLSDGTTWRENNELIASRLYWSLGLLLTAETIGYFALKDLQYYYPTTKFHTTKFSKDMSIYKQMDKAGHFMHSYYASETFSRTLRWAGVSGKNSVLYGTISGWLWMLQIEIADGFFEQWGFSMGDLIFNTLGSGFSAAQQLYPETLGGIQPKISYSKSDAFKNKTDDKGLKSLIDDYEGVTWWLAVNAYHYMPAKIQNKYPEWLKPFGLAVGMSAKGIMQDPLGGERELFIGLDFDLRKISFGDESSIVKFLKHNFNMIRLPMPAVRISPGSIWYGIYF